MLNIAVAVLTLCAVVTTALVVRRELFSRRPAVAGPRTISAWRSFGRDGHRMGRIDAAVNIVVFSDFQCPFCAVLMKRLRTLRTEYPGEVAIVYRHFPLSAHRQAVAAAQASECASAQGRFDAFLDALFSAQDSIGLIQWARFATIAGVRNIPTFRKCAAGTEPIPALARDTVAGNRLGVHVTPTLLINETRLEGAQPLDTLEAYVARALHHDH